MSRRTIRFGVVVGLIGGGLMAAWIMAVSAATGNGFLTPVNLIAHTFWDGAPLDGAFEPAALVLGVATHLTIAISIGLVLAALVEQRALDGGAVFLLAVMLGTGAWVVQAFAWPAVDGEASSSVVPWAFAGAHVIFSVGSALVLNRLERLSPDLPGTGSAVAVGA